MDSADYFIGRYGTLVVLTGPERKLTMRLIVSRAKEFLRSEEGPTTVEYAVMLALIIAVAIGAIALIGKRVSNVFSDVDTAIGGGAST